MEKLTDGHLPLKINLEMFLAIFGLSGFSLTTQIYNIRQYQQDYGLILRLDGWYEFPGQLVSDGLEEGGFGDQPQYLTQGPTHWLNSQINQVELGEISYCTKSAQLSCSTVRVDSVEFYVIDEPQMHPERLLCSPYDVYVDKDDFIDFTNSGAKKIHAWADPTSKHYAPELEMAIKLHSELRVKGHHHDEKTMLKRVEKWLIENLQGDTLGASQIERIATIIGDAKKQPWPKKRK